MLANSFHCRCIIFFLRNPDFTIRNPVNSALKRSALPHKNPIKFQHYNITFYKHCKNIFYIVQLHIHTHTPSVTTISNGFPNVPIVISAKGWYKICCNKIESWNELVSQCDQLTEVSWLFRDIGYVGWCFFSSLLSFYYIVRILSMPKFYVFWSLFPLLKSIRPRYVASFFPPITMQCCSSVNTIPIGWLRSIKNLFWISLVVHIWFGGNSSTVTMTWLFQLASCLGECRFGPKCSAKWKSCFSPFFSLSPVVCWWFREWSGTVSLTQRLLRTCCITIYQLKASVQNLLLVR